MENNSKEMSDKKYFQIRKNEIKKQFLNIFRIK